MEKNNSPYIYLAIVAVVAIVAIVAMHLKSSSCLASNGSEVIELDSDGNLIGQATRGEMGTFIWRSSGSRRAPVYGNNKIAATSQESANNPHNPIYGTVKAGR